jgi:hypothetical protein
MDHRASPVLKFAADGTLFVIAARLMQEAHDKRSFLNANN